MVRTEQTFGSILGHVNWGKVLMTFLGVVIWICSFLTRHFTTRKGAQLYGLKWSESFQRRYANVGAVIMTVFFGVWIWFLWAVVE